MYVLLLWYDENITNVIFQYHSTLQLEIYFRIHLYQSEDVFHNKSWLVLYCEATHVKIRSTFTKIL